MLGMITYEDAVRNPALIPTIEDASELQNFYTSCTERLDQISQKLPNEFSRELKLLSIKDVHANNEEFKMILTTIFVTIKESGFEQLIGLENQAKFNKAYRSGNSPNLHRSILDMRSLPRFFRSINVTDPRPLQHFRLKRVFKMLLANKTMLADIQAGRINPNWTEIMDGAMRSLTTSPDKVKAIERDLKNMTSRGGKPPSDDGSDPGDPSGPSGHSESKHKGMGAGPGYDRGEVLVVNDSESTTVRDMVDAAFQYILAQEAIVYVFTDLPQTKFKATPKAIFEIIGPGQLKNVPTWGWDHGNFLFLGKRGLTPAVRERLRKSANRLGTERYPKVTVMLSGQEASKLMEEQWESLRNVVEDVGSV